jgi:hypothetical protein
MKSEQAVLPNPCLEEEKEEEEEEEEEEEVKSTSYEAPHYAVLPSLPPLPPS